MASHKLRRLVLEDRRSYPITAERYAEIVEAKRSLLTLMLCEEKYDIVVENYFELESHLLEFTTRAMMFHENDWSGYQKQRNIADRRLINLLSACRLYRDQIAHDLSSLYGSKSEQSKVFKQSQSTQYDGVLGYRVMEELRNHAQHRELPIHLLGHSWSLVKDDLHDQGKHTCRIAVSVSRLKDAGGFKDSILRELEAIGEDVDLKPMIREYISAISDIHDVLRTNTAGDINRWDLAVEGAITDFTQNLGEPLIGLAAVKEDDDGRFVESSQLFGDFINRRKLLARKNHSLKQARWQFASGEVEQAKKS